MLQESLIYLPSIVGIVIIAGFVWARSRQSTYRYYGAFSFCVALFLVSQFLLDAHYGSPRLWFELSTVAGSLSAALFVPFVVTYPLAPLSKRGYMSLIYLPAVMFSLLSFTNLLVRHIGYADGKTIFNAGPLYAVQTLVLIGYFAIGLTILLFKIRHSSKRERMQLYLMFIAFSIALAGAILAGFIFVDNAAWQAARPFSIFVMVLLIAYAIVSHGLFDIRFFAVRAAAYLSTLILLSLIFIAPVVSVAFRLVGFRPTVVQFIGAIVVSVAILYGLQYLKRFFDGLTTRVFFRNYYDPQDILDQLSEVLVRTADVEILRTQTADILAAALRPTVLKYVLFDDVSQKDVKLAIRLRESEAVGSQSFIDVEEVHILEKQLSNEIRAKGIKLVVRLRTTHEDLGYMLVGHKQSGEIYSERDRRLLGVAADEIAISLQNALRFQEIQRFNITLQERIDDATRKLRRTNQRLRELDETKDDFISMASHQLRTPLTSVKGYLSLVLEGDAGKLNETQVKMLRQAFSSSQRMVFLITDLLNISRLKTGKFVIETTPVDLSALVQEEVEQLHESAEIKQITLSFTKPATFPKLMLDETKVRQVIMNYIDNALYYTPVGGKVAVELTDKPATVELRVVDGGIGVPKAEQPHLFTKFYRATNARKARPDGTGLGLFMAKKAVTAQGGSIVFSSREGHGSTFGFVFSKTRLKVPENVSAVQHSLTAQIDADVAADKKRQKQPA